MHQSLVKFSESEASNHTPSSADFTTTTPELKFLVHTGLSSAKFDRDVNVADHGNGWVKHAAEQPKLPDI